MSQKVCARLLQTLCSVAMVASLSSVAHATWTPGLVRQLTQPRDTYDSGRTRIYLTGQTCAATGGFFFIANDTSNREQMIQILLAAFLAGRSVNLGHGSTCEVYSVSVQ